MNVSVCRFCDFHVQGEFKRLNSHRGPLITATVGARLGAHAKTVGKQLHLHVAVPAPVIELSHSMVALFQRKSVAALLYMCHVMTRHREVWIMQGKLQVPKIG